MMSISRRTILARSLGWMGLLPLGRTPAPAEPVEEEGTPVERTAIAEAAATFMNTYDVPGLSVAIARRGRPVYAQAFGFADKEAGERLTPAHRLRIASVTKPITSVAIFALVEAGRVRLENRVFGPNGVLGNDFGAPPYRDYVDQITVEHLLTHTGGGWQNDASDPMFRSPGMSHAELIAWTLRDLPLHYPPGTHYAYSNFGYCVLGRVIEKLSGQRYDTFVRDAVLRQCGLSDMEIAGNSLAERRANEVRYYSQGGQDPYGMNVARMDSHGGWIGRPLDLAIFSTHVDGFADVAQILKPETLRVMTTPSSANPGYAKGWAVNAQNNWWHVGSLPGTVAVLVRTHSDFCWAATTNARAPNSPMERDLDRLVWKMVHQVSSWHA
jgi:CubicO group peptidase (beta-lactamase class C family)